MSTSPLAFNLSSLRRFAHRDIDRRIAVPWMMLVALSPFWFIYLWPLISIFAKALTGVVFGTAHGSAAPLGNDFLVFWPVGQLAGSADAARIYDPTWFSHWQAAHLGTGIPHYLQYFYPPPSLLLPLLTAPFHIMSGFLIWSVVLTGGSIFILSKADVPKPVILAGCVSIASLLNMLVGQLGFLTGAIFIAGLLAIDRSPARSGSLLGCLAIKPQAGLLGPVALLARGHYGGLVSGGLIFGLLGAAVTLLCGWAIWPAYFNTGLATAHHALVAPFPTLYEQEGISVFWMCRSFGASVTLSGMVQAICAMGAIIWCWVAWRRTGTDRIPLVTLTVFLTLLVTPYGYTTDLCGVCIMTAWLAWERRALEFADVAIWAWPAICPIVCTQLHMELSPLILLLGASRAWQHLGGIGRASLACYPAPI